MIRWLLSVVISAAICSMPSHGQDNWPRFRGPNGAGVSDATIPTDWSDSDYNWKTKLLGIGHSSPVVWGSRVFLTCGDANTAQRTVCCLDTEDGHLQWQRDYPSHTFRQHGNNSYATATPAVDDAGVVVTWTTPEQVVLLALSLDGRELWRREFGPFVGPHGSGASPILVDDLVVLANEQEDMKLLARILGRDDPDGAVGKSFVIAVDRMTGKTRWQLDRRTALAPYSTPCMRRVAGKKPELIFTSTAHGITAVDPTSGRVNWEVSDIFSDRCVGSPVLFAELVIAGYGHGVHGSLRAAVRPGTNSPDGEPVVAYELANSVPLVPTPIVKDGRLFLWTDGGVVSCLKAASGEVVWRERVGGSFYGSPVCVGDRLYCIARNGDVVVLAATDNFELLARVPLGEPSFTTPAVAKGVMYLRTQSHLYSLGGPGES